jgi:hypothetical protein
VLLFSSIKGFQTYVLEFVKNIDSNQVLKNTGTNPKISSYVPTYNNNNNAVIKSYNTTRSLVRF